MELLIEHLGKGLFLILMLSLPPTLLAAAVGLIVGILQAVTQVQEQTISAAPKLLLVYLMIIFGGGLMLSMLSTYLRESAIVAFQEVPEVGTRLLPPLEGEERQQRLEAFFKEKAQRPSASRDLKNAVTPGFGQQSQPLTRPTEVESKPKARVSEEMHFKQEKNSR